ncbi:MAG: T9SS type A sorting domain-containing protein [Ignavibacteriales bacterium]|nr:T9SS type A sorting domain-containing protein [Ignavibacteriales bacterium]
MRIIRIFILVAITASASYAQAYFGAQNVITDSYSAPSALVQATLDSDFDVDIVYASFEGDAILYVENLGGGNFADPVVISTLVGEPTGLHLADMDGDTDLDLLSSSAGDDKIAWYENNGFGSFGAQQIISTAADGAESVFAADIDADGDMDVVSSSVNDGKVAWYDNTGTGWTESVIATGAGNAKSVGVADLDGDLDPDVFYGSANLAQISWHANDGAGNFGAAQVVTYFAEGVWTVKAADMDADSDIDLVAANRVGNQIAWYQNDGSGSFTAVEVSNDFAYAADVHIADLDGDGDPDILATAMGADKVSYFENLNGAGEFGPEQVITRNAKTVQRAVAANFDGDGDFDVVSTSYDDNKVAWYEGLQPVTWIGGTDDDWFTAANWDKGFTPIGTDYALINPATTQPRITSVQSILTVGGLEIASTASLNIAPSSVDTFYSRGHIKIYGTLDLETGATKMQYGGEWVVDPLVEGTDLGFLFGQSEVVVKDGAGVSDEFYDLKIETGGEVVSVGNITVGNKLIIEDGRIYLNPTDTLTLSSSDTLAIEGDGFILEGTIKRALEVGLSATYRFESPKTIVVYPDGNEPNTLALSMLLGDPNFVVLELAARGALEEFPLAKPAELEWEVVADAVLDTAAETYTIHDADENGTWTFGFIDSTTGKPRVVPLAPNEIAAGTRFMRRTYRGSSGRNAPKEAEDAGPTYTFRWDKTDMPETDPPTEEDWSELLCFKLVGGVDVEEESERPASFRLEQNYPNPFNPTTAISYALPEAADVRLDIYNILGEKVATLVEGAQNAGSYVARFNATNLGSGVYFYRIDATTASGKVYREARKMTLMK